MILTQNASHKSNVSVTIACKHRSVETWLSFPLMSSLNVCASSSDSRKRGRRCNSPEKHDTSEVWKDRFKKASSSSKRHHFTVSELFDIAFFDTDVWTEEDVVESEIVLRAEIIVVKSRIIVSRSSQAQSLSNSNKIVHSLQERTIS